MKRSLWTTLALLISVAMLLSSCAAPSPTPTPQPTQAAEQGAGTQAPTSAPQPTQPPKPVSFTFWYALGGANGEAFMRLVNDYMKENPHVKIEAVYTGSYAETGPKVIAALAANTLPNGGLIPGSPRYTGAEGNFLIEEYAKGPDGLDLDDFWPVLRTYTEWDGRACSMPFNNSTLIMYYNKDLMKQANLDPNSPPQTWDELKSMATEIVKKSSGANKVWGVDTKDPKWTMYYLIPGAGGEIMNETSTEPAFASEAGYAAMTFWKELADEGLMPKAQHKNAEDLFLGGRLAFYLATTGGVTNMIKNKPNFDWGTAFVPKKERHGGTVGGAMLTMFPSADKAKQDATWKFIKWLVSPENVVRWTIETGYVPVRKSTLQDPKIQALFKDAPQYRAGFEQLQYAGQYKNFVKDDVLANVITAAIEQVELGKASPQAALDEAAKTLKAEMK